ncbi:zinc finger protein 525 [Drosophila grimshawi]|uniref:GH10681 n=1 Tax=Drosophila grimshawi TaxID=7222 RepID=B4JCE2_DROGR|nr:zinc finger protein 525 [Drosophila grimshawi]EDW03096.1 GH10681 [Drosophila grimshawi]
MEEVCRICTSSSVTLVDIFSQRSPSEEEPCLADMLNECANCHIRRDDPLPQQICLSCILAAQNAFRFKRRCEQSHQHFCRLLTECGVKVEQALEAANQRPNSGLTERIKIERQERDEQEAEESSLHEIQINRNSNAEKCPHCAKALANRGSLKRHILIHSGERPYKCQHCPKAFNQSSNLIKHMRVHSGERPFQCVHCRKAFTQSNHLANHMRVHPVEVRQQMPAHSNECSFESSRTHSSEGAFQCSHCPKRFVSRGNLERHKRVHSGDRPYKCSHCPKTFTQSVNLERHKRVHSGIRPFQCLHCPMAFTQSSHLVNHVRIHSGERPFKCHHCFKCFTRRQYLEKHSCSHSTVIK